MEAPLLFMAVSCCLACIPLLTSASGPCVFQIQTGSDSAGGWFRRVQGLFDPGVGRVLAVVDDLGVEPEEDGDAVPGPAGDLLGDAGFQPQGHAGVSQ